MASDFSELSLRSEGAGTDSSVTRCLIFVLLMPFIKNTGMSCVNFINSCIFNVLKSKINEELEVFDCNRTPINVMLSRDAPVITDRRLQRVEQFFGFRVTERQRCKLCRKLGRSFPVGLGTSSRILRGSPVIFVLSSNFAVTYTLFGYYWVNLPDFQHYLVNFGHFWANFEHFLTAFISRFLVNGSDSQ